MAPCRARRFSSEKFRGYALTEDDKAAMQTTLAALSENLATVAGVLGLE